MIVRCVTTAGDDLPPRYLTPRFGIRAGQQYDQLVVGCEYVVYAIGQFGDTTWYYILEDEEEDPYPAGRPASLFEVVEGSASERWKVDYRPDNPLCQLMVAFHEWIGEGGFYDRLSDYEPREVAIFKQHRKEMDAEAIHRIGRPLRRTAV